MIKNLTGLRGILPLGELLLDEFSGLGLGN
jgi:hypothetical protein